MWLTLFSITLGAAIAFCAAAFMLQPKREANNPQQSWGFVGDPPEAVIKDSGTREGTLGGRELQLKLIQQLVRHLLIFDIVADRFLVLPNSRDVVTPRPEFVAKKIAQLAFHILCNPDRAFSFLVPDHL